MAIIGFIGSTFLANVVKTESGFGVQIVCNRTGCAGPVSSFRDFETASKFAQFCAEAA